MLKMIAGLLASGSMLMDQPVERGWDPPIQWLRLIFHGDRWPDGWGLYFVPGDYRLDGVLGDRIVGPRQVVLSNFREPETGRFVNFAIRVGAFPFVLAVADPDTWMADWTDLRYRLPALHLDPDGPEERAVMFSWGGKLGTRSIRARITDRSLLLGGGCDPA